MCESVNTRICVRHYKLVNENSHLKNNLKLGHTHIQYRGQILIAPEKEITSQRFETKSENQFCL
jgi:hypothetical protein